MEFKCAKCGTPIGHEGECFVGESGPICPVCLKNGMVYHALRKLSMVQPVKYTPKAIDIQWDVDMDMDALPQVVLLPAHIIREYNNGDDEAIGDYLSELTGFCHKGYAVVDFSGEAI